MSTKNEIDKIININGSFEIRIPFPNCVIGWGNCLSPTAYIEIYSEGNDYIIDIFNKNEEKRKYRPHGTYKYIISQGQVTVFDDNGDEIKNTDRYYLPTPFGWNKLMTDTLDNIINELCEN